MTNANEKGVGQMQMLKAQWALRLKCALESFISCHCPSWEDYFKGLTPVSELLSLLHFLSFPKTALLLTWWQWSLHQYKFNKTMQRDCQVHIKCVIWDWTSAASAP